MPRFPRLAFLAALAAAFAGLTGCPPAPVQLEVAALPDGYVGESYSQRLAAQGGTAPLAWSIASGALPSGLTLGQDGTISGAPAALGEHSFEVRVDDAKGTSDSATLALAIYAPPAISTPSTLADLTVGQPAAITVAATGGKAPLHWTRLSGTLPAGLALSDSGELSGTVSTSVLDATASNFELEVRDSNGRTSSRAFAATAYRAPTIDTAGLADATETAAYVRSTGLAERIEAHDGKPPLLYAASGLPSGLGIDGATGIISGTPPPGSGGTYTVAVTVVDAGGRTAARNLGLKVWPEAPRITAISPGFGTVTGGTPVTVSGSGLFNATVQVGSQTVAATAAVDGTWVRFVTPGANARGPVTLTLTSDRGLSATGTFTYTLERTIAADGDEADWSPAFSIGVNPAASTRPGTDLEALYAAYDADNFYVGVRGTVDATNGDVLLLYLDVDPGSGRGVTDFSTMLDNAGELDNACTNDGTGTGQYAIAAPGFAADFCGGTKGLASAPYGTRWPDSERAGLRALSNLADYPWVIDTSGNMVVVAAVRAGSSGFTEFLFPWAALYPGRGAPRDGARIAMFARVASADGNVLADQALPQDDDAHPNQVAAVAEVEVHVSAQGTAPWYQGPVFYELFVRSFQDSNGDGRGDLQGLVSRLDYLNDGNPATTDDLGVDALWLMPVFESPSYHGYDATSYEAIEPDYGSLADFDALISQAHQRGIRVYLDLVLNHTSNQHPWFVDSASSPAAAHRDWYVWRADDPGWTQPWSSDPVWHLLNGAYYYGLFWDGMPDLNYRSTAVRDEMKRIAALWIARGVDGYRLDATPTLVEDGPGAGQQHTPETHAYLRELRDYLATVNPEAAVVAENWADTPTIATYYGQRTAYRGDQVQMSFDFPIAGQILDALWSGDAAVIASTLVEVRALYPFGAVDATFLTNHDQVRIATQLGSDRPRLGLAAAILLTLPGTPFVYYGEELGAQNGTTANDEAKRAPMAWSSTAGGGFTSGSPWYPLAPGQATANVASQSADPTSLLSRYRALIRARKASPALSSGQQLAVMTTLTGPDPLLVFVRSDGAERVLVAHNLGATPLTSPRTYDVDAGSVEVLFADPGASASAVGRSWRITLPAYGSAIWRLRP